MFQGYCCESHIASLTCFVYHVHVHVNVHLHVNVHDQVSLIHMCLIIQKFTLKF